MSKKRRRESNSVDIQLVEIYEDLTNESEEIRLKAAHVLLSHFSDTNSTKPEQAKKIIIRLFRGLCSSRKAARLGFSVALTEYLSQVFLNDPDGRELDVSGIIDILESQTAVEGSTSGQASRDERDHYFGRLFGAEAIIKSSILVKPVPRSEGWKEFLDVVCGLAIKKPWLRRECGWLLYSCISGLLPHFAVNLVEKLSSHKLIRTPEGVAIWLQIRKHTPSATLPKHLWKHNDPLNRNETTLLADVLKDARPKSSELEDGLESQGNGMWTPQLHFVWDVILRELYPRSDIDVKNGEGSASSKRISFEQFWVQDVDQSLFVNSSSTERKHWGLMLLSKVLSEAPSPLISAALTNNTVTCLANHLGGNDRYLHRSAQKVVRDMHARVVKEPDAAFSCLSGIVRGSVLINFDQITKTKTVEKLVASTDAKTQTRILDLLTTTLQHPGSDEPKQAIRGRKTLLDLLVLIFNSPPAAEDDVKNWQHINQLAVLENLVRFAYFDVHGQSTDQPPGGTRLPFAPESRQYMRSRIITCLESALKSGLPGQQLFSRTIAMMRSLEKSQEFRPLVIFEAGVKSSIHQAWKVMRSLDSPRRKANPATPGLSILYSLTILQVYNGDVEAVEILDDLQSYNDRVEGEDLTESDEREKTADALIEILLSFISKPSKFFRRISLQAFGAFAAQISLEGLQSLIRVLEASENSHGQQDMFDADGSVEGGAEADDPDGDESRTELSDSDVERFDQVEDSSSGSSNASDAEADGNEEEGEEDEELSAFEAKLAAALGTRKGEDDLQASDSEGADEEMNDDEMEALDDKLAEVFQARKTATRKKKDHQDAKETMVNFKNRVLDLLEVYFRQEYRNPLSLQLVLPLLVTARKTKVKQLSVRACSVLRDFCRRGKGGVPIAAESGGGGGGGVGSLQRLLESVHLEAGLAGSHAHATACSQASLLLVKTLSINGVGIDQIIDVYAETRKRQMRDQTCQVSAAFFTDWNNWCASAKDQMAA